MEGRWSTVVDLRQACRLWLEGGRKDVEVEGKFNVDDVGEVTRRKIWVIRRIRWPKQSDGKTFPFER